MKARFLNASLVDLERGIAEKRDANASLVGNVICRIRSKIENYVMKKVHGAD